MRSRRHPFHRLCFWLLLAVFIGLFVWWLFYIPYDEKALRRAIPCEAVVVSEHHDLARRWREVAGNPLVEGMIRLLGQDADIVSAGVDDAAIQRVMDLFASRKTILAYTPSLGAGDVAGCTVSTWIGGRSLLVRSGLLTRSIPGLTSVRLKDGSRIWTLAVRTGGREAAFSFAVMDGVLFGCLSEDPVAVQWLLFKMQGRLQPALSCAFAEFDKKEIGGRGGEDRGWIRGWGRAFDAGIQYRLREFDGRAAEATVWGGGSDWPAALDAGGHDAATLTAARDAALWMFARPPDLSLVTSFALLSEALQLAGMDRVLSYVRTAIPDLQPDTDVFAVLYGGEDSGRILGLRVPSVVIGVRLGNAAQVVAGVGSALDAINAKSGWGLIPRHVSGEPDPLVVIDSTRGGVYSGVDPEERLAVTARGQWLLVASNVRALRGLTAGGAGSAAAVASRGITPGAIWVPADGIKEATVYAQAELAPAAQSIKDGLAVFSLGLLVSDDPARAQRLEKLARARAVVDAVQALGTCAVWLDTRRDGMVVRIRIEEAGFKSP